MNKYILKRNGKPKIENDIETWASWFESSYNNRSGKQRRRVKLQDINVNGVKMRVSTVFLGLDHGFNDGGPVLWETMVFIDKDEKHPMHTSMLRCSGSRWQAYQMHKRMVKECREQELKHS